MSKFIKINVQIEGGSRANATRSVLAERYNIETLWQTNQKDSCIVRLTFDRSTYNSSAATVEELKVTDEEFDRLEKLLTADEKEK